MLQRPDIKTVCPILPHSGYAPIRPITATLGKALIALFGVVVVFFFCTAAQAATREDAPTEAITETITEAPKEVTVINNATDVMIAPLLYLKRPIVVFADSPLDPNFQEQVGFLDNDINALSERDVIVILDTNPTDPSPWRLKLRPRGFSLVLMDKNLTPVIRKPLPWEIREILAAIDKFPLRRQEALERSPAGR